MTTAEYDLWLSDLDAPRVLLAELDHSGGTQYVATAPFISKPTDSDPNRIYDDCLDAAIDISTRIDGLIGFGEVAMVDDGSLTDWIPLRWQGHPIRLYLGGPDWPRDDFRLLAQGVNGGIITARQGELRFAMNDQSARLDEPIDTGQLPNDGGPVPLALGSIYNAPAYLLQPDPYEWKASFLPVTSLRPKSNGNASVSYTANLQNGSFVLGAGLDNATLTVDIEEQTNTPARVAQWVAMQYGITVGQIEMPGYRVGLYYNSEVSGRQILDDLCDGMGAYWFLDATGRLIVRQHKAPGSATLTMVGDDIVDAAIQLSSTEQPWQSLTLRWRRNYQTLSNVAGVVSADERARLTREWSEHKASQSVSGYPLVEKVSRDTCIQRQSDIVTETNRLLGLHSVRRDTYSIEAFTPPVDVGMTLAIDMPPLNARACRLIAVSRSPTRRGGSTNLEVWL
ncbi:MULTISPECIES: hypothetical protein [unclassified Halomonas]|uniref:hypothetical protein n=1 Tax=unclassified Halomonas TaxID=2609666 RepID=UPI002076B844|nr:MULTISPECIES: hypothetical protein [unclassified Halomonas]